MYSAERTLVTSQFNRCRHRWWVVEKEFAEDKYSILDVRARDEFGHRFNIQCPASLLGQNVLCSGIR